MWPFDKHHRGPAVINVTVIEEQVIEIEGEKFHHHNHHRFSAVFFITIDKNTFLIMDKLTIDLGQTVTVGIEIYDKKSGKVLDKAVASAQTYAVDDPTKVTAAADADPTKEDLTGADFGTASLTGTVVADLSAYGLDAATPLSVDALPLAVAPTPAARFV